MKNLLLTVILFVTSIAVNAQGGKEVLFVENFSHTNKIGSSYVEGLRNNIIEGMTKTGRLEIQDVNAISSIQQEKNKQTEDASTVNPETLTKFKNLNAKYLLQGHITTLEAVEKKNSEGKTYYSGSAVFALKVINVENGTIKATKSYTYSGSGSGGLLSYGVGDSPDKAIASLLKTSVESDMKQFINENFPIEGTILEIVKENKGKATEVYINLGNIQGLSKGQAFKVYVAREVAGRASQKEIGELKIEAVEGDDISLCKVNKGGDVIKTSMGEQQVIIIKSIHKESLLGF